MPSSSLYKRFFSFYFKEIESNCSIPEFIYILCPCVISLMYQGTWEQHSGESEGKISHAKDFK